jgi:hypothetical protein
MKLNTYCNVDMRGKLFLFSFSLIHFDCCLKKWLHNFDVLWNIEKDLVTGHLVIVAQLIEKLFVYRFKSEYNSAEDINGIAKFHCRHIIVQLCSQNKFSLSCNFW